MKNKLKTIAVPRSWSILRKKNVWTMKPKGPHRIENSIPVATVLKEYLKYGRTTKEVKNIVYQKGVFVDNRRVRDINLGVGIMDIVEIPSLKEKYVMSVGRKGKLGLVKTESNFKIARITGKKKIGKKFQLNLFGGKNILVEKDSFSVGDSLVLGLKDLAISEHIKLEEGVSCVLLGGSHVGETGKIKSMDHRKITITGKSGDFETLRKFVYVLGKEKPLIDLEK